MKAIDAGQTGRRTIRVAGLTALALLLLAPLAPAADPASTGNDQLPALLRDGDASVRAGALRELRNRRLNVAFVEAASLARDDGSVDVRREALSYLFELRADSLMSVAANVLRDDADESVRDLASRLLSRVRKPEAIGPLAHGLLDSSSAIRKRSAASLVRLRPTEVPEPLLKAAAEEQERAVRSELLRLIRTIPHPANRPALHAYIQGEQDEAMADGLLDELSERPDELDFELYEALIKTRAGRIGVRAVRELVSTGNQLGPSKPLQIIERTLELEIDDDVSKALKAARRDLKKTDRAVAKAERKGEGSESVLTSELDVEEGGLAWDEWTEPGDEKCLGAGTVERVELVFSRQFDGQESDALAPNRPVGFDVVVHNKRGKVFSVKDKSLHPRCKFLTWSSLNGEVKLRKGRFVFEPGAAHKATEAQGYGVRVRYGDASAGSRFSVDRAAIHGLALDEVKSMEVEIEHQEQGEYKFLVPGRSAKVVVTLVGDDGRRYRTGQELMPVSLEHLKVTGKGLEWDSSGLRLVASESNVFKGDVRYQATFKYGDKKQTFEFIPDFAVSEGLRPDDLVELTACLDDCDRKSVIPGESLTLHAEVVDKYGRSFATWVKGDFHLDPDALVYEFDNLRVTEGKLSLIGNNDFHDMVGKTFWTKVAYGERTSLSSEVRLEPDFITPLLEWIEDDALLAFQGASGDSGERGPNGNKGGGGPDGGVEGGRGGNGSPGGAGGRGQPGQPGMPGPQIQIAAGMVTSADGARSYALAELRAATGAVEFRLVPIGDRPLTVRSVGGDGGNGGDGGHGGNGGSGGDGCFAGNGAAGGKGGDGANGGRGGQGGSIVLTTSDATLEGSFDLSSTGGKGGTSGKAGNGGKAGGRGSADAAIAWYVAKLGVYTTAMAACSISDMIPCPPEPPRDPGCRDGGAGTRGMPGMPGQPGMIGDVGSTSARVNGGTIRSLQSRAPEGLKRMLVFVDPSAPKVEAPTAPVAAAPGAGGPLLTAMPQPGAPLPQIGFQYSGPAAPECRAVLTAIDGWACPENIDGTGAAFSRPAMPGQQSSLDQHLQKLADACWNVECYTRLGAFSQVSMYEQGLPAVVDGVRGACAHARGAGSPSALNGRLTCGEVSP